METTPDPCSRKRGHSLPEQALRFALFSSLAHGKAKLCKLTGLLHRACNRRKDVIRVAADNPDGADHNHENHCQHNCVLGNILTGLIGSCKSVSIAGALDRRTLYNEDCHIEPTIRDAP